MLAYGCNRAQSIMVRKTEQNSCVWLLVAGGLSPSWWGRHGGTVVFVAEEACGRGCSHHCRLQGREQGRNHSLGITFQGPHGTSDSLLPAVLHLLKAPELPQVAALVGE